MTLHNEACKARRTLFAIVTAHLIEDAKADYSEPTLASGIAVELDRSQLLAVTAMATVMLAEAWADIGRDMGMEPAEFVQTLALAGERFESPA